MHELILGGQRSGKSRAAEARASGWLARGPQRSATLIATALPGDAEMQSRIDRHRVDRAARAPGLATLEAPHDLVAAVRAQSRPERLLVIDCLTLWLTNLLMPAPPAVSLDDTAWQRTSAALLDALRSAPGPLVLVSNEIGLGVTPMGAPVRRFVDELGRLHQAVATCCDRVTLMVAGIELPVADRRGDDGRSEGAR